MLIQTDQRVLFAGRTGSGKTWLAKRLLAGVQRLVVIDAKATLTDWELKIPGSRDWSNFHHGKPGRFRILPDVVEDQVEWYEELFERLYAITDLTLYIDEAYAVTPPNRNPNRWLTALYTRGRELGIGVWAATQRPVWIPLFMVSEADWIFTFRLNLEADRKRIAEIAGEQVFRPIPDKYGFYVHDVRENETRYYAGAKTIASAVEVPSKES